MAFNIKEEFVGEEDASGFSRLIDRLIENEIFQPPAQERYPHRLGIDNNPLYYVAMVGEKQGDIPAEWL